MHRALYTMFQIKQNNETEIKKDKETKIEIKTGKFNLHRTSKSYIGSFDSFFIDHFLNRCLTFDVY